MTRHSAAVLATVCVGAVASAQDLTLENPSLRWQVVMQDEKPSHVLLQNKLSGQEHQFPLPGISIQVDGLGSPIRELQFVSAESTGESLVLTYLAPAQELRVALRQRLVGDGACVSQQAELRLEGGGDLLVRRIGFGPYPLPDRPATQGIGQPVCSGDLFLGAEHPAAINLWAGGAATLTQCPAKRLGTPLVSKPVVIGVGNKGGALEAFRKRLAEIRVPPPVRCPFVNYNTWWTLMPPTEANCKELLALFRAKLFEATGESFDTFTIDDGWDVHDSLWAINQEAFPSGFAALRDGLKGQKANLGLWISPSSGYSHGPWCERQGYAVSPDSWLACFADARYQRDMTARVLQIIEDNDLDFIKFDGFYAGVPKTGLDDIRTDPDAAREANCDGYIEMLRAVRQKKPGIFLDPTCGIWLSPYWLQWADSLWGELGGDYPTAVVPSPQHKESATTTRDDYFIQRVQQLPAFPPDAIETLGIIVITPEPWQNDAMAVLGRGTRLLTLYINPQFMPGDEDWQALAHMLRWARAKAETLLHTQLIGGKPTGREPYGFAHFRPGEGILSVRNPWIAPQKLAVKLGNELGEGEFRLRSVYPYREVSSEAYRAGEAASFELQGYEQRMVEVVPANRVPVSLAGRYDLGRGPDGKARPVLYRRAPEESTPSCRVSGAHLLVHPQADRPEMMVAEGTASLELPANAHGRLLVLSETHSRQLLSPEATVTVNGAAVQEQIVKPTEKEQGWWLSVPLTKGRNEVRYTLAFSGSGRASVSAWAEVQEGLVARTTDLGEVFDPNWDRDLPLPPLQKVLRTTWPVSDAVEVLLRTWPGPEVKSVYLDELEPDEIVQDWGTLQVRQSVWQEPMIIAGKQYERGVGTHANGRASYHLAGGGFKTFECEVGRDEHAGDGKIVLQVLVDGKVAFASGPMTRATPAKTAQVDVSGAKVLELVALDGGDGISGDHANWAEARLSR